MVDMDTSKEKDHTRQARQILLVVFVLTAIFMIVEVFVGLFANSLALLADAGHMLSDVLSLGLSVFALVISQRPRNSKYTFGYYRAEILAALFNGLSLVVISGFIITEAIKRLGETEHVLGTPMLIAAVLGLLINIFGLYALRDHHHENLNVSSAFFHIAADLLGSVAAIIASIMIIITGNAIWDIIISIGITILIVISGAKIIHKALMILMQRAPDDMNTLEITNEIKLLNMVENVHDLHIWAIDQEKTMLTAHIEVSEGLCQHDRQEVMRNITNLMGTKYHIQHTTLQVEHPDQLLRGDNCGCN